jgi:hypothetical protein
VQGKNEPLCEYIERFNKKAIQVRGADEKMKKCLIKKGLRQKTDIKKVVNIDEVRSLKEFLRVSKTYIRYEEKLYTDNLNKTRKEYPHVESCIKPLQDKKKEGKPIREGKELVGRFAEYTSLAVSREKILAEIVYANMKEVGIKFPKATASKACAEYNIYCCFHKCHGHANDECIHLKHAIEILIQREKLRQFTKNAPLEGETTEAIVE